MAQLSWNRVCGLFLLVSILSVASHALAENNLPTLGNPISLHSEILGEERNLWVYLPPSYDYNPGDYPVLYLLDGSYHFRHVTASVDFLADRSMAPEMIVVGIVSNDLNRARDYTPSAIEQVEGSGGADRFIRFFREELIPHIDDTYRTASMRILAGHSYGGLFTTYALVTVPDLFNAYIAVSPSLYWDERVVFSLAEHSLRQPRQAHTSLYFTMGSLEREAMTSATDAFAELLSTHAPPELRWEYVLSPGDNHDSIQLKGFYAGLATLFEDWRVPWVEDGSNWNFATVRSHYDSLSQKLGYDIPLPEYALNALGYRRFGLEEPDSALAAFELNVELHPHSADAHFQLGRALLRAGKRDRARVSLQSACDLGARTEDPRLERYRRTLGDVLASSE